MSEYTVTKQVEQGKEFWFVLRNGTEAVSRHQSSETAWNSASAKAHGEASAKGSKAEYTTATIITDEHDDNGPRACWKVS